MAAVLPALVDPITAPEVDAVLEALDELDRAGLTPDTRPVVSLALRGVTEGWGPSGARLLARHAAAEHLDTDGLIQRLTCLAAPVRDWVMQEPGESEPVALLAYSAIDSTRVGQLLAAELRHGDDRRRACMAGAATQVLRAYPDLLTALLPGILDGLWLADHDRFSTLHPTARLQDCLAHALAVDRLMPI